MNRSAYLVLLHFFNNHLELLFSKFEGNLIESVLSMLKNGLLASQYEVQADCCTSINNFNEWVLEKLSSNSLKNRELIRSVQEFCNQN